MVYVVNNRGEVVPSSDLNDVVRAQLKVREIKALDKVKSA